MTHKKYPLTLTYFLFLLLQSPLSLALTPENGWWWNEQESGRGFNIEVQNKLVSVAVYIYDDTGHPTWFIATGSLDAENKLSAPLLRFDGGQCISCDYQKPNGPETSGSLSIKFNSTETAEIIWAGSTIAIKRLNFGYGQWYESLLGEWMLVKTLAQGYSGDRLSLSSFRQEGDNYLVSGHRTNDANISVLMTTLDNSPDNAYRFLAIVNTTGEFVSAFAFNFTGLNSIQGIHRLVKRNESESNVIEQLTTTGKYFVGKRM